MSTSQFISIFTLILGILLFASKLFNKDKPQAAAVIEEESDLPQD